MVAAEALFRGGLGFVVFGIVCTFIAVVLFQTLRTIVRLAEVVAAFGLASWELTCRVVRAPFRLLYALVRPAVLRLQRRFLDRFPYFDGEVLYARQEVIDEHRALMREEILREETKGMLDLLDGNRLFREYEQDNQTELVREGFRFYAPPVGLIASQRTYRTGLGLRNYDLDLDREVFEDVEMPDSVQRMLEREGVRLVRGNFTTRMGTSLYVAAPYVPAKSAAKS